MRTVIAIPPLHTMTGGIAVFYQIAERLRECGFAVALAGSMASPGLMERREAGFAVLVGEGGRISGLGPDDVYLIPEGWPNLMAPALAAKSRVLVYAQNWAYLFSALPENVSWDKLPVRFLAVSDPVDRFMRDRCALPALGIVRPAIDAALFRPLPEQDTLPGETVRIAWMPRKNKALAEQIRQITAVSPLCKGIPVEWVEIRNMSPDQVAQTLAQCHIFLASGFPEGCPLPPLEAMASGCLVVGFSGFGGWDYMRQADPGTYLPRIGLRSVSWSGNGLFAADGDVPEAAYLLAHAVHRVHTGAAQYRDTRCQGLATAAAYSPDAQRESVRAVWSALKPS